ncbi:response regulator [Draconibacterium sp. IB214405]|uniref:response regulator n=1 Tax=Draconibacterium sp. IB214405 TaxID=3097352 RepID=UPI002A122868|nr:response regulator [Draconibacterium sp. IB214405]MDX8338273.1 response regulator [Draconibacterium sp. IB214405]
MNERPKILYVDDEEINTTVFQLTFSNIFEVVTAGSGETGIEVFRADPDIKFVISDMRMPLMSGLEFIREIKTYSANIPCTIMSGYQQGPEITEAIAKGEIVDYMTKPFNKRAIEQLVKKHINGAS